MEFGWVAALDCEGRTTWIVDAHRGDGRRFVVHADEILTAFLELEAAVKRHASGAELGWCRRYGRSRARRRCRGSQLEWE